MSKLIDTRQAFLDGAIGKPDFIRTMYERHHAALFDYADYLKHTNIASIEISDGRVLMTSRDRGIKIICPAGDYRVAPVEILNFLEYEITDSNMIMRLITPDSCVLDIGANMGWYAINIAMAQPTCVVHAFEPIPDTFAVLNENVALNGIGNVITHHFGFSSEKKDLSFFFYPEGSGNASSVNLTGRADIREVTCHVELLDDATEQLKLGRVDFIKCDVEGAELFVFQGGQALLARDQPIVFAEMLRKWAAKFDYHPNQIIALFSALGYRCFTAGDASLREFFAMDQETVETNFFFLHGARHAALIESLLAD
ncbi:FkbM family methyltransferase [Oxalobacteraceae bacterium GrIS 1.11]